MKVVFGVVSDWQDIEIITNSKAAGRCRISQDESTLALQAVKNKMDAFEPGKQICGTYVRFGTVYKHRGLSREETRISGHTRAYYFGGRLHFGLGNRAEVVGDGFGSDAH